MNHHQLKTAIDALQRGNLELKQMQPWGAKSIAELKRYIEDKQLTTVKLLDDGPCCLVVFLYGHRLRVRAECLWTQDDSVIWRIAAYSLPRDDKEEVFLGVAYSFDNHYFCGKYRFEE